MNDIELEAAIDLLTWVVEDEPTKEKLRQKIADTGYCHTCFRKVLMPLSKYRFGEPGTCKECRCISCRDDGYKLKIRDPLICGNISCLVALHLPDLKKQWFALRCLNKSSSYLFHDNPIRRPFVQFAPNDTVIYNLLDESEKDMRNFILDLAKAKQGS